MPEVQETALQSSSGLTLEQRIQIAESQIIMLQSQINMLMSQIGSLEAKAAGTKQ
jgi:hypothetical protein